jgi:cellulose synthase/poly-beta-1,6-N-acetylglucosamine synthase-like glycosyltransferase
MPTDVVVCNYRTPKDLSNFGKSLIDQPGLGDIVIVNNAPNEQDRLTAKKIAQECGGTVVNNKANLGYSRSLNAVAADLTNNVLALFNADVVTSPGSILEMEDFIESHPKVGIAGPKQTDQNDKIVHGGIIGTNKIPRHRGWQRYDRGQYNDTIIGTVTVSGSAFFVRRTCWEELTDCETYQESCEVLTGGRALGALLPTRHYYEETYCCVHADHHGWKNAYVGRIKMTHLWHRASPHGSAGADRHIGASRETYRAACDYHGIARE